ncbi:MAG: hypothetical protein KAJ75_09735 [Alphaproteobacteria bacterium]|nr:hypothetical protein [Alphaproteobacteria bacterium]
MKLNAIFLLAVCIIFKVNTADALTFNCARENELTALHLRSLQSQLMVAALSCGKRNQYNAFVIKHKNELASNGRVLIDYFKRTYKYNSQSKLDDFVTILANEASSRSISNRDEFCSYSSHLLQSLLMLNKEDFADFAWRNSFLASHSPVKCSQKALLHAAIPLEKSILPADTQKKHETKFIKTVVTALPSPVLKKESNQKTISWWQIPIEKLKKILDRL